MNRNARSVLLAAALAGFAAAACPTVWAAGTAATVYAFNGGATAANGLPSGHAGDPFNNNANGVVFSQMGLLNADGSPPTVNGNNLQNSQGQNVGTVIRNGNQQIIGYQTAGGKMRAYNLDAGATLTDAWNAVATGGQGIIDKHGVVDGGEIVLDNGNHYAGFKQQGTGGTGTGTGAPVYPLPPRPGAGITINVNGCYTTRDWDDGGPGTSVTGSTGGIPGVGGATGNPGMIYKNAVVQAGGTDAQKATAKARLAECARNAGFVKNDGTGDIGAWAASMPQKDQLQAMKNCVNDPSIPLRIAYEKTTAGGCGGAVNNIDTFAACYYAPITIMSSAGGQIHYQPSVDHNSIDLHVPPGALLARTPVFLTADPLGTSLPGGTGSATYVVGLRAYGPDPTLQFLVPATLRLTYPLPAAVVGFFELLPSGGLQPVPAQIGGGQVVAQLTHGGDFVALTGTLPPVPAVTGWLMAAMSIALLGFGVLSIRRQTA